MEVLYAIVEAVEDGKADKAMTLTAGRGLKISRHIPEVRSEPYGIEDLRGTPQDE